MAVKKKGGKGKKKGAKKGGGDDGDGVGIALPEDKIKYLQSQTQALELELAYRSETTAKASSDCKQMLEKVKNARRERDDAKQMTLDVTQDMTRQYKGMRDELLSKINEREHTIQSLRDELDNHRDALRRDAAKAETAIRDRDEEIACLKEKMEHLSVDFAHMLADALKKMKERIEVHSATSDDQSVPIQHRMEEFHFRADWKPGDELDGNGSATL